MDKSHSRIRNLCMMKKEINKWSDNEVEFIKTNYLDKSVKEIAELLNRGFNSVKAKVSRIRRDSTKNDTPLKT